MEVADAGRGTTIGGTDKVRQERRPRSDSASSSQLFIVFASYSIADSHHNRLLGSGASREYECSGRPDSQRASSSAASPEALTSAGRDGPRFRGTSSLRQGRQTDATKPRAEAAYRGYGPPACVRPSRFCHASGWSCGSGVPECRTSCPGPERTRTPREKRSASDGRSTPKQGQVLGGRVGADGGRVGADGGRVRCARS